MPGGPHCREVRHVRRPRHTVATPQSPLASSSPSTRTICRRASGLIDGSSMRSANTWSSAVASDAPLLRRFSC
jgi:hypothetical protein